VKKVTPETDFPALIAQRRADLGLTQAAAAKAGGVEPTIWSRTERGQSKQLTLTTALRMLKGVRYHIVATTDDLPETPDESDGALFSV
jgi:transcriptional regulator with XRE-family HTH domain